VKDHITCDVFIFVSFKVCKIVKNVLNISTVMLFLVSICIYDSKMECLTITYNQNMFN